MDAVFIVFHRERECKNDAGLAEVLEFILIVFPEGKVKGEWLQYKNSLSHNYFVM